ATARAAVGVTGAERSGARVRRGLYGEELDADRDAVQAWLLHESGQRARRGLPLGTATRDRVAHRARLVEHDVEVEWDLVGLGHRRRAGRGVDARTIIVTATRTVTLRAARGCER